MEEEVLIVREGGRVLFDFPKAVFARLVARRISSLNPISVREREGRVLLEVDRERGEELRAWLLLNLDKGFFITELESMELK